MPENVNGPVYRLLETKTPGLELSFEEFPGGTGAMVEALQTRQIDVAIALSEGLVRAITRGGDFKLIAMYTASPLTWGVHVKAETSLQSSEDLRGACFAISREGSGSHLMALVEAQKRGWPVPTFCVVNDLDGARTALAEYRADAFLWEKYTTKPLVDSGEWRRIDDWKTPWPAFAIAAHNDVIRDHLPELKSCLASIAAQCEAFAVWDQNAEWIAEQFGLKVEDVHEWLTGTRWDSTFGITQETLELVVDGLRTAGLVSEVNLKDLVCDGALRTV